MLRALAHITAFHIGCHILGQTRPIETPSNGVISLISAQVASNGGIMMLNQQLLPQRVPRRRKVVRCGYIQPQILPLPLPKEEEVLVELPPPPTWNRRDNSRRGRGSRLRRQVNRPDCRDRRRHSSRCLHVCRCNFCTGSARHAVQAITSLQFSKEYIRCMRHHQSRQV